MAADETLAVLRAYAASWVAGDLQAVLDAYSDDAVFHYFGTTDLAGTHVGKDACVAAMVAVSSRAERRILEVVDILAGEHLGSIVVREELTRDGEAHELRRVLGYRVEAGKIAECWVLDEDQRLVDHLWRP